MDVLKNALLCRLCGTNIVKGKCKNIFEESTDLIQKIKETLPITISADDNGSRYICLSCHDRINLYHKFMQDVVEHNKKLDNQSQVKSLLDLSKEVTDFSKIHSDAVYTCPNCNVDLMILLVSNPLDCDYTFQISLTVVGHSDKNHVIKERNTETRKTVDHLKSINKNDLSVKHITQGITQLEETKNVSDQVRITLPGLQEEKSANYTDLPLEVEDCKMKLERKAKRQHKEPNSVDQSLSPPKTPKVEEEEEESYEADTDVMKCAYDPVDIDIKIEPGTGTINWVDSETDYKSETDICIEESQEITGNISENDDVKLLGNYVYKPCPRIVCKLCGARYLSQMKYDFHMERHKLDKMDKYQCTLCNKEASTENLLWDHYYHTHKSVQRFVCIECGKLFTKRSRLNGHQKSYNHSGIKEIQIDTDGDDLNVNTDAIQNAITTEIQGKVSAKCNLCGKLISDLDPEAINDLVTCTNCEDSTLSLMVDGNEAKVISPRQYHCSKCPKHFVRKERLEFHEMRHNENMNEFVCSTCGKDFSAENSLYEHYLFVHIGARPHICELCGKSFQLKARLKEHHRTHTGERPYQCDICGQRCRTTNALKLHRKIHFSHNRYMCNICNKSFSKKQNMNEHLEKHWKHDKNVMLPQVFTCPVCVEDFPTYRMLKYHMTEIHKIGNQDPILTKQKPWYECQQCHEKFKHQMSLKAHKERVHEGRVNPLYQCDICNATYRIKQLLVNHIKSKHDGEKRYKCAQCEKGFNDTKSLYNHILLHTGKKPYVCEYCNMSFRRKDSRDHHRRKHTGEQPYQCPDCGESFSTYNNRSKHRKREHGEGESECPECGEKCNGQQEIRIHLNKHLGEKLNKLRSIGTDEI